MNGPLVALGVAAAAAAAIAWTPPLEPDAPPPDLGVPQLGASPAPGGMVVAAASPSAIAALISFAPQDLSATTAPADPAAVQAAPPPKPPPPALVGLLGTGGHRVAYISLDGQTWRASVGDRVGAWRLASIGARAVTLARPGRTLSLALYGPRPAAPTMPTQPFTPADTGPAAPEASPAAPPSAPTPSAPQPLPPPPASTAPKYWVGPPGSAPPGYTLVPPSALPPPPTRRPAG